MGLRLHPPEALIEGVTTALDRDRQIALILGSSLASPLVPDGEELVAMAREAVSRYPDIRQDLETALAQARWGHEAQTALGIVQERLGPEELEALARRAVRMARADEARDWPDDQELERDLEGWRVPPGLAALGRLLARRTRGLGGPVLSLGWDPLLAVAVLQAGGRIERRILEPDGTLARSRSTSGGVELVHLNGFWRDPESLRAAPSATRLAETLAPLLRDHAVVVLGAVPRDDALLQALTLLVKREDTQISLTWAFTSDDRLQVKTDARSLLQRTEPLSRTGRFRTHGGVHAGPWLCDLERALVPAPAPVVEVQTEVPAPPPPEPPRLPGWTRVNRELLQQGTADLTAFAEGLTPSWGEVGCGHLAERDRVQEIEQALTSGNAHKRRWSVQLLLGPDGEGKSTVARQVAARVAQRGGPWCVWWREGGALRWDQVAPVLTEGTRLLLVSDTADTLLRRQDLNAFLDTRKLDSHLARGNTSVHLLLVASSTDWRRAARNKPRWLQAQQVQIQRSLHEFTQAEARRFALAAEAVGLAGQLDSLPDPDACATRLAELSAGREHTRLLGALVAGRTGETLEAHVSGWLLSLRGKRTTRIPKPLSVWLHAAALHVAGLGSVDQRILRAALQLDDNDLDQALATLPRWLVPERQGKTTRVAVGSSAVAHITLEVMDALRLGVTRAQVHANLATGAIKGVRTYTKDRRVNAVPRLAERLWRTGHPADGLAMAAAAHATAPLDATFARTHARLLRESGDPSQAAAALSHWLQAVRAEQADAPLERATLQEWTACARAESHTGQAPWAAWLALFALSDQAGTRLRTDSLRALLGVADALASLDPDGQEPRAVQGRAAAVAALQHAPSGALGERELQARAAHAEAVGSLWRHLSPGAVGACLSGVAKLAWDQADTARQVTGLPEDGRLTFNGLGEALQAQGPKPQPPQRRRGPPDKGQQQRKGRGSGRKRPRKRRR